LAKKIFSGPNIPTPFGRVQLPDGELPPFQLPTIPDKKGRAAIGHAMGHDLANVLSFIPLVGTPLAEGLTDLHFYNLKQSLTPAQYEKFVKYDKFLPTDILPLVRAIGFED